MLRKVDGALNPDYSLYHMKKRFQAALQDRSQIDTMDFGASVRFFALLLIVAYFDLM